MPMQIAYVAAKLTPFSGHGVVAHSNAALPKALHALDHRITVFSPLYRSVSPSAHSLARRLSKVEVTLGDEGFECEVYDGRTAEGLQLVFVGHPDLLGSVDSMEEGDDDTTVARRAAVFAAATVEILERSEPTPDTVHGFDWVGALTLAGLERTEGTGEISRILTIQEPDAQPSFGPDAARILAIHSSENEGASRPNGVSPLVAGVRCAHQVTTVSPTTASHAVKESGDLPRALAELGDRFSGLTHGVDAAVWNPATDPNLTARFDPMDLSGKARCKAELQRRLGLPIREDIPLLGILATGATEAGFDLLETAGPKVLRNDCQIAIALESRGQKDETIQTALQALSERWPDRIQVRVSSPTPSSQSLANQSLAHEILGASDLVLVPSRSEPCGFTQMAAHRYGALPIVRRVGSLADTVVDCDARLETGSGFIFDDATPEELLAAVRRAFAAFRLEGFDALRRRVMRIDHSWDRSARRYERIYRDAASASADS